MKKKKLIIVICIVNLLLIGFLSLMLTGIIDLHNKQDENEAVEIENETIEVKEQPDRQLWLENKSINDDYQGEIRFLSGLIDKPFVQAKSIYNKEGQLYHFYTEKGELVTDGSKYDGNDVYIWTNWKDMSYDFNILGGSVFMDYRCDLDSQNIIIYGHHFSVGGGNDPERNKAFTPVEKLLEEENYQDNNMLELVLDNETRTYELASVYIYDVENNEITENCQYWRVDYSVDDYFGGTDEQYYEKYISALDKYELYETGVELSTNDKTLTIQTCIGGSTTEFEVLVFKLINTEIYNQG